MSGLMLRHYSKKKSPLFPGVSNVFRFYCSGRESIRKSSVSIDRESFNLILVDLKDRISEG